jgi:hypothetical protein
MVSITDFGNGRRIFPYSASQAIVYGTEAPQKFLPVTLDAPFSDPVTGAICSRFVRCDVTGTITLEYADSSTSTMMYLAGVDYFVKAFKVKAIGTTATGLHWAY